MIEEGEKFEGMSSIMKRNLAGQRVGMGCRVGEQNSKMTEMESFDLPIRVNEFPGRPYETRSIESMLISEG